MNNRLIFFLIIFLLCTNIYSEQKLIKISANTFVYDNNTFAICDIEVSEHKITVEEWKDYLKSTKKDSLNKFEHELKRIIDSNQEQIVDSWPVFGITWLEAAEYCNWLSLRENLKACYTFNVKQNNVTEVITNYEANGYRLPTVTEWFYLSELWMNKNDDYYKSVNIIDKTVDLNNQVPYSVKYEVRNSFGVYDILGNVSEMCNNYYIESYSINNYLKDPFGPITYTPDPDLASYKEALTEVRCVLGGDYSSNIEFLRNDFLYSFVSTATSFTGFRVVRKIK